MATVSTLLAPVPTPSPAGPRGSLLLGVAACCGVVLVGLTGCETSDPCKLRQAACMDLTLLGKRSTDVDMVSYSNVVVTVFDLMEKQLGTSTLPMLTSTAYAGIETVVTLDLPDSFNAQQDLLTPPGQPPWSVLDDVPDANKIDKLKELRKTDPRAVHITVTATESSKTPGPVGWDSKVAEACFSMDEWLMQKYFRVGKDQYVSVFPLLLPLPGPTAMFPANCPKPGGAGQ